MRMTRESKAEWGMFGSGEFSAEELASVVNAQEWDC